MDKSPEGASRIAIVHTTGQDKDFVLLCEALDKHLTDTADDPDEQKAYDRHNGLEGVRDAFVAYADGVPAGCVAFKRYDDGVAEVKRMFVADAFRGRGIAKSLLAALEEEARKAGYASLILESAMRLKAAHGLYRDNGFAVIPNYGQYADMGNSLCMRKEIG